jgi:hypothetical protein
VTGPNILSVVVIAVEDLRTTVRAIDHVIDDIGNGNASLAGRGVVMPYVWKNIVPVPNSGLLIRSTHKQTYARLSSPHSAPLHVWARLRLSNPCRASNGNSRRGIRNRTGSGHDSLTILLQVFAES